MSSLVFLTWMLLASWQAPAPQSQQVRLKVSLRHEIPHPQIRALDDDLQWQFAEILAMHPRGERVAVLIPQPVDEGLRRRPAHGRTERKFRLQWVRLSDGAIENGIELPYLLEPLWGESEVFGFSMARSGGLFCAVAGGSVVILDDDFRIRSQFGKVFRLGPKEEPLQVISCDFFNDANHVALLLVKPEVSLLGWEKSAIAVYNWRTSQLLIEMPSKVKIEDVAALEGWHVIAMNLDQGAIYHYRVAEFDMSSSKKKPLWKAMVAENGRQRLLPMQNFVFRGEWDWTRPSDVIYVFSSDDRNKYDRDDYVPRMHLPAPGITGRIRSWRRGTGKRGPEFALDGFALVWPIAVSLNEEWLAARAVHYTQLRLAQFRWDDNRFVIFDINRPKKPIYVSENFGPEEAITGLAFTPDRKALVVATSRRLLIYDVKEGEAGK